MGLRQCPSERKGEEVPVCSLHAFASPKSGARRTEDESLPGLPENALDRADAMLVVGTSLMVYSGYRFCERAQALNRPIAAVNLGRTRADALFELKLEAPCADALPALVASLERHPSLC